MTELTREQLEGLERLLEKAAPGPWEVECGDHTHRYAHIKDDDDRTIFYKYGAGTSKQADRDEADASLIVAMRNALPALISAAKAHLPVNVGEDHGSGGGEKGWLIEGRLNHHWYAGLLGWTYDAHQAVRFCRKRDAEILMGALGLSDEHHFVSEHVWIGRELAAAPTAPPPPDGRVEELVEAARVVSKFADAAIRPDDADSSKPAAVPTGHLRRLSRDTTAGRG